MNSLLVYDPRQRPFDIEEVEQVLQKLEGISRISYSPAVVAAIEADYASADLEATIRLISTRKLIVFEGTIASMTHLIFSFFQKLGRPLNVIDETYSFDIDVSSANSAADLAEHLEEATA